MSKPPAGFRRARTPENKQVRALALIDAARTLALREGVRSVTLNEIAATAGVHASAVRRYFESREEIYLRLAATEWEGWAATLESELDGAGTLAARDLAAVLARTAAGRPLFCDLLAHVPLSLERSVSEESVRAFKIRALDAFDSAVAAIRRAVPDLSARDAADVVTALTAMVGSLWQIAHPSETMARVYEREPRLAHTAGEFLPRLARLLEPLVLGLLADGGAGESRG
ncbi:TetR family transcriptional regulator [Streptomyces sp. NPDC051217]|uniref:TetR/AcrR family transcriptional regulator n=1 Tax=Streptomyces sp. NPDC051217 TaxID=3365644 RepID=UPI00378DC851